MKNQKKPFKTSFKSREDKKEPKFIQKIIWIYSQVRDKDFWFVDVEGIDKWYFVYPKNALDALDWDEVEAWIKIFNSKKEAVIIKVTKRAQRILVWSIDIVKDFWFVILDNKSFKKDIYIPAKNIYKYKNELKNGYKVAIKITKWVWKNPQWSIVEVLGDPKSKDIDINSLIIESQIPMSFPKEVLDEAKKLDKNIPDDKREDLMNTLTITIDWDDAKDLDDAISLEKIQNIAWDNKWWYKLIVSIADVSHYVKENSKLDIEARERWNSTYLPHRVIPMLPEELSNNLCSLNPNTKKLTLSCEMIINTKWEVISSRVFNSIIKSDYRLTYKETQDIIESLRWKKQGLWLWDKLSFWWNITKQLQETIQNAYNLKDIISKRKKSLWVLDFDFPETKIELDNKNNPISIKEYPIYESNKLIEEFMVITNETIWKKFSNIPFIYRIHEIPDEDSIEKLRETLAIFGIILPYKDITPILIAEVIEDIKKHLKSKLLSMMVLRSLKKAIYSHQNFWHFGLAINFYSHFTSPIRRYPDLLAHRIIKEKLTNKLDNKRKTHYESIIESIAKHTSDTSRKSEKLEYMIKDYFICKYYEDKVWEEFDWVISGMIPAWFFVSLKDTTEGFISFESIWKILKTTKFDYDEKMLKVIFPWLELQVWDNIKIKIWFVDLEKRRLDFDFLEKYI